MEQVGVERVVGGFSEPHEAGPVGFGSRDEVGEAGRCGNRPDRVTTGGWGFDRWVRAEEEEEEE